MKLITTEQERQLLANGRWNATKSSAGEEPADFHPVVKLFCPWGSATWLLTELDPEEPDIAFGLCDLGLGFPELGNVRLSELVAVQGPGGLRIERDRHFSPRLTLGGYAAKANAEGRVIA